VHPNLQRVTIKILNPQTHEIVREIPPERMLEAAQDLLRAVGLLLDRKA